jgi:hypothetical protein
MQNKLILEPLTVSNLKNLDNADGFQKVIFKENYLESSKIYNETSKNNRWMSKIEREIDFLSLVLAFAFKL